jgi:Flp pilus assembly pilin Flp
MKLTKNKRITGQTMTEMIIIVGLIAVGCIAAVAIFGKQIKNTFARITAALGGTAEAVVESADDINDDQDDMGDFEADVEGE